ncbi:MAG: UDP-3-O-(3-hydroxymyristoyl)glucosamine N-acyltransferase [Delftia sp.]|jgi:UDP-3-O-[3-hydroxymyristoyl] glucosamine N-acyltransferase|nr:UDP-3-O-(3-hydroxymyristoyl)glucosamine N-acyltransferase [Delftia sp.]
MVCKWIIGAGEFLDIAFEAWQRAFPEITVKKIIVPQNSKYEFDLSTLQTLSPSDGSAFVAFDERFGNFKRMELMSAVIQLGFKLDSFISPRAIIASNVKIGPNTLISDGTIIGYGSSIEYNSVLMPGVQIGSGTQVRPSCWIEAGVLIGNNVKIGAHCTFRTGVSIRHGLDIGRYCELGWPQCYEKNIAPKTIFDSRYDAPIYTYQN